VIVRFADSSPGKTPLVDFPSPYALTEFYKVAVGANPKAIVTDFSLGTGLLSEKALAEITNTLSLVKSAVATELERGIEGKSKEVRFNSPPTIERVAAAYDIVQGYTPVRLLNFSSEDWSDAPFVNALAKITEAKIPEHLERKMINFYGPPGTIEHLVVTDLRAENAEALAFKLRDRIVFFGYQTIPAHSGPLMGDREIYSSDLKMSDTEIRATIAANILDDSFIRFPSDRVQQLLIGGLTLIIFLIGIVSGRANAALPLAGILLAFACGEHLMLERMHTWIPGLGVLMIASCLVLVINALKEDTDPNAPLNFGKCRF